MSPFQPIAGSQEPKPPKGGTGTVSMAHRVMGLIQTEAALDEIAALVGLDSWTLEELVGAVARLKLERDEALAR